MNNVAKQINKVIESIKIDIREFCFNINTKKSSLRNLYKASGISNWEQVYDATVKSLEE